MDSLGYLNLSTDMHGKEIPTIFSPSPCKSGGSIEIARKEMETHFSVESKRDFIILIC